MASRIINTLLLAGVLLCGCQSVYYSAWEKFGVEKRDILKKRVVAARDGQKAASDQFKDAYTRLKEVSGFNGGDLERTYQALQRDYDRSVDKAQTVHKRVKDVETVAQDLFAEWEKEIKEISSGSLRDSSRDKLRETRRRYDELHAALKQAEKSMDPVLARFHDQVLYLKHNLNAAAIVSLKGEAMNIQSDITRLLADMNAAIAESDRFINALP